MKELKYLDIKQDLYLIREDGAIYSKYKKDYMNPIQDKDGYLKIFFAVLCGLHNLSTPIIIKIITEKTNAFLLAD